MRKEDPSRRPSLFEHLFAERQLYLRSGMESRYVTLSRPLQIGVALGMVLIVAWLAIASYSSVANHLEAAEQSRELARLEGMTQTLTAKSQSQRVAPATGPSESQVELRAALDLADADRARAEQIAAAAEAEAEEVRRELALATERLERLESELETITTERDSLAQKVAAAAGDDPAAPDAVGELRAELEETARRVEELSVERTELQAELEVAQAEIARLENTLAEAERAGDAAAEVRQELADAEAANTALREELDAVEQERADLASRLEAPAGTAPAPLEPAEITQLRTDLEDANRRIAELEASREAAAGEIERYRAALEQAEETAAEGDLAQQVAALKPEPSGFTAVPGAPTVITGAEATLAALVGDLAAASDSLAASQATGLGGADYEAVQRQLAAASGHLATLETTLAAIKTRDAALQTAFSTLAPLPAPPNPRR